MKKSYTISTISNCQGGGGVDHYLQSMIVKKLSNRSFVAGCAGLRADAAPISENIYASLRYSCHPCPWRVPCFKGPRHTIDKSSFSVADDFCILIFSPKISCCYCRCCCCCLSSVLLLLLSLSLLLLLGAEALEASECEC